MKYFLIIFLGLCTLSSYSQKEPDDILDPFFDSFENSPDKAIDYIFTTNPYIKSNQAGINGLKERLNTSRKLLGEFYGEELIDIYYVGNSFVRYEYMLKYARQPVKITIILYRPDENWLLYTMQFDDKLHEDFKKLDSSD